jgi:hypothetical protein
MDVRFWHDLAVQTGANERQVSTHSSRSGFAPSDRRSRGRITKKRYGSVPPLKPLCRLSWLELTEIPRLWELARHSTVSRTRSLGRPLARIEVGAAVAEFIATALRQREYGVAIADARQLVRQIC